MALDQKPATPTMPTVFVNHGGGPMPILGQQPRIVESLLSVARSVPKPRAIVVVSAHYCQDKVSIMSASKPKMYYDYHGFSPSAYEIQYPAPNDLSVVSRVENLLSGAGIANMRDEERGYDHGIFVPLKIMYPSADIPVIGVSQPSDFDTDKLWKMGQALAPLRNEGILLIGSGSSFHSFSAFFRSRNSDARRSDDAKKSLAWDAWLRESITEVSLVERECRLKAWKEGPQATFAHPTDEHLTPLLVMAGAALEDGGHSVGPPSENGLRSSQFIFKHDNSEQG